MGEIWGKNLTLWDRPLPKDVSGLSPMQYRVVSGDYFRALRIRVVHRPAVHRRRYGACAESRDHQSGAGAPRSGAVRIRSARSSPSTRRCRSCRSRPWRRRGAPETCRTNYAPDRFTIVGVADDVRYGGLAMPAVPLVYVPYAQGSEGTTNMFFIVRTDGDPLALTGAIREQIAQLDRDQPVADVRTMEARLSASVAQRRMQMNVLGLFAAMAVLLAVIGIYGVMSYSRDAALARDRHSARARRGPARCRRAGAAAGIRDGRRRRGAWIIGALLLTRILRTLLFNVSPTDPLVFSGIVLLLALTSWIATYIPARRAAGLDPLVALRTEPEATMSFWQTLGHSQPFKTHLYRRKGVPMRRWLESLVQDLGYALEHSAQPWLHRRLALVADARHRGNLGNLQCGLRRADRAVSVRAP